MSEKIQRYRRGRQPTKLRSRHLCLLIMMSMLALKSSSVVSSFSLPDPKAPSPKSSLSASRETLPPFNTATPDSNSMTTSTTISSLPSFQDDDPWTAAYARIRTTVQPMVLLVSFSLVMAMGMVAWEDYGAANLWPSRRMIVESTRISSSNENISSNRQSSSAMPFEFGARTVHGLAFGKAERLQIQEQQLPSEDSTNALLPEIRTYNEVSEEHRGQRVARWHTAATTAGTKYDDAKQMEAAVQDLRQILLDVIKLETLAADYQWEQIHTIIQSDIVPKLEPAATVLRYQLTNTNNQDNKMLGYEEVGFDWGSCAWRHCGALADAQEALDELDHLLGVLEPPECLFCLNVAERSLRDMLAVVPVEYKAMEGMPAYSPYQSAHYSEDDEFGEETDVLDKDYLRMLQELRNSDDDTEDGVDNE